MADRSAVVVGAGLGGLAAAVALAGRGHRVTLLERGARPGGYAVAFRKGGFSFDPALHVVPQGGPGGEFRRMADELGLSVGFIRLERGFEIRLGDLRVDLPNDWRGFFDTLAGVAPAERPGLDRLRLDLERHAPVYQALFDPSVGRLRAVPPFIPRLPRFLRHSTRPAADYLAGFVGDARIRALLFAPAVFMGLPPSRLPALTWQMMAWILLSGGMYTIAGGGQALTDTLADRLRQLGGQLVTRADVTRIEVERGRAVGVATGDGRLFPARAVISAVSLPATLDLLAGAGPAVGRHRRRLAGLLPSTSALVLSCGLSCDPREAGIASPVTLAFPEADLERIMTGASAPGAAFSLVAHGLTGLGSAFARAPARSRSWRRSTARAWLGLAEPAYRNRKEQAMAAMLAGLDRRFPGLAARVEVADLATPRTLRATPATRPGRSSASPSTGGAHRRLLAAEPPPGPRGASPPGPGPSTWAASCRWSSPAWPPPAARRGTSGERPALVAVTGLGLLTGLGLDLPTSTGGAWCPDAVRRAASPSSTPRACRPPSASSCRRGPTSCSRQFMKPQPRPDDPGDDDRAGRRADGDRRRGARRPRCRPGPGRRGPRHDGHGLHPAGRRPVDQHRILRNMSNAAAAWISLKFKFAGPSFVVGTACSSGAYALAAAHWLIASGRRDVVVAGAADSSLNRLDVQGFSSLMALAEDEGDWRRASRPFDRDRSGFVIGEGGGVAGARVARVRAPARGARV